MSSDIRTSAKHIPWKDIAGFRDIAAHKYQSLFMEDVYNVVVDDFPELKRNLVNLLNDKKTE